MEDKVIEKDGKKATIQVPAYRSDNHNLPL
jgi:hypothetical protein